MEDNLQSERTRGNKPVVVGPKPFSFEEILRNIDPAPDDETERFVREIYADRRRSAPIVPSE